MAAYRRGNHGHPVPGGALQIQIFEKIQSRLNSVQIDDWFPLKPFDRLSSTGFDASLVARVMISYDSNVKLDPKDATHIEDLKGLPG